MQDTLWVGCLTLSSIEKIFYDKIDLRLFYFDVAKHLGQSIQEWTK